MNLIDREATSSTPHAQCNQRSHHVPTFAFGLINVINKGTGQANKLKTRVLMQLHSHVGDAVVSATATGGGSQIGETTYGDGANILREEERRIVPRLAAALCSGHVDCIEATTKENIRLG